MKIAVSTHIHHSTLTLIFIYAANVIINLIFFFSIFFLVINQNKIKLKHTKRV